MCEGVFVWAGVWLSMHRPHACLCKEVHQQYPVQSTQMCVCVYEGCSIGPHCTGLGPQLWNVLSVHY